MLTRSTTLFDWDQFETELPVNLFVNLLKTHGFLKGDSPRFSRCNEAKIANKENPVLVDGFSLDTLELAGEQRWKRAPEVVCQGRGTENATVVKLSLIRLARRSHLTVSLQIHDNINEPRGMRSGLNRSLGECGGDDVSSCLFDYAEPVEFQLTDDRCFPCAWRAGNDEPSHMVSFSELCVGVSAAEAMYRAGGIKERISG
jgi:hypothetical protein